MSTTFADPLNWLGGVPQAGDDLMFSTGPGGGEGLTSGSVDCSGMQAASGGAYASVTLDSTYTGRVTLSGGFTTDSFTLAGGTIDQSSSSTNITVTSAFDWTGGTLNSTTHAATLNLNGATATINPGETNTILSGSTLNLVNSASLTVQPGTVELANGVGLVAENATVFINAQKAGGAPARVTFVGLNGTFATDNRIFTMKTGSFLTASGAGIWDNQNLALVIAGGTLELKDGVTGQITNANTNLVFPVDVSSGTLRLHTGCTLTAAGNFGVGMSGGILEIVGDAAGTAKFNSHYNMTGGTISFTGNKAIFEVIGDVTWKGGSFKPRINVTADRINDTWSIGGSLSILPPAQGQPITATIAPVSENWVPNQGVNANFRWTVIRIVGTPTGVPLLTTTGGPNYQRYVTNPPGSTATDWMLGVV